MHWEALALHHINKLWLLWSGKLWKDVPVL